MNCAPLQIYLGFDSREAEAFEVACSSILKHASAPVAITPIRLDRLRRQGLMVRPYKLDRGVAIWDEISNAPQSTEFAITRFLTPILAHAGVALFADSDIVVLGDIAELFALADRRFALQCVPHEHVPSAGEVFKMDGQVQLTYPRKNWSSVMLFNCDHPANGALTVHLVNRVPGRDLHRFCWLEDEYVGTLPAEWNWLVNVEAKPRAPKLAHFTLGGPWLPNWRGADFDTLWLDAQAYHRAARRARHTRAS